MKKIKLLLSLFSVVLFVSSCSDSHTEDGCHECHIALENADGSETMWEMTNSAGGEDFCADELTTVEDPSYMHSVTGPLVSTSGSDTLTTGEYGQGNGYEIHCEDHGDQ